MSSCRCFENSGQSHFCTVRAMHYSNSLVLSVVPPFVLFFGIPRPLFHEATFLLVRYYYMLNGLSERGTAHSLCFEVFIDDHDVYCFAGDSTLKSKFAN